MLEPYVEPSNKTNDCCVCDVEKSKAEPWKILSVKRQNMDTATYL